MNELIYKITQFDEENKVLSVVFEDGAWANITLVTPLPETPEAVDEIVKRFAAPVEHLEAKQSSVSLAYLTAMVGVPRTTQRFSLTGRVNTKTPEEIAAEIAATEAAAAEAEAIEAARIRTLFDQFMAEREAVV